jgi:hypothetical protein
MAESVLDVFNQDAFGVISLTDAVNHIPFIPGRAGEVINWEEEGITTTTAVIEEQFGTLSLVNPTPRGGPGQSFDKDKRKQRSLVIPHYQIDDGIYADSVQGVREFGQGNVVQTIMGQVTKRMEQHVRWKLDPTLEYQRIGALKGTILNGNGSTLYNLFTEFGVTQETEVAFDLSAANPAAGVLREKCDNVDRLVAANLGGIPYAGLHAFCGETFWKNLIAHSEVREIYLASQTMAMALLNPMAYKTIKIGNITFEEYRGSVGGTAFIHTDKCHIFPIGVPGLWRTLYAPADYIETVNTVGLPRYAKQFRMPNDKGINMEIQSNALNYCVRPKVLIQGKRGS